MNFSENTNTIETTRLRTFQVYLKSQVSHFQEPLWVTNFELFFSEIIKKYEKEMEPNLIYSQRISFKDEVSLWITQNHHKEIIHVINCNLIELPDCIYDTVLRVHPKWSWMTNTQLAISQLIFFVVIFDIAYVNRSDVNFTSSPERLSCFYARANLPFSSLNLPICFGLNENKNLSIRDFFMQISDFDEARNEFLFANFSSNPFDVVFRVHKALTSIECFVRKQLNEENKGKALAFDDLFVLFYGAFLSSDFCDVFAASRLINSFLKKFHLCPAFEYAKATLEALVIYLESPI
ncbi:uncharacterized protein GO595_001390 [Histomonas meleagridis]|uniref:uncharacterized protein n=1 Tax=Histomonas meleagridis TaxID=135588 RepID=UPI00355A97D5|nr:hypothetical protein GO595_001390 [Histomonas meleagridis]